MTQTPLPQWVIDMNLPTEITDEVRSMYTCANFLVSTDNTSEQRAAIASMVQDEFDEQWERYLWVSEIGTEGWDERSLALFAEQTRTYYDADAASGRMSTLWLGVTEDILKIYRDTENK